MIAPALDAAIPGHRDATSLIANGLNYGMKLGPLGPMTGIIGLLELMGIAKPTGDFGEVDKDTGP
jgi:hypothetical protein